ncbi:MAG: MFS transporter [Clostridia bacterium]
MKLSASKTIKISLAFAWISIFNSMFDTALPIILVAPLSEGGLALNHTMKGLVMALDNILGLFILPLFGLLSDRSKSKFGKRTPFIIVGGILAAISWLGAGIVLSLGENLAFLILLGLGLTFISISRPAALSLLPDLTALPLRRKANAITQIISAVATLFAIVVVSLLLVHGFDLVFYAAAVIMLVLIIIFLFTVHERRWAKEVPPDTEEDQKIFSDYHYNKNYLVRNRLSLYGAVFFFYVAFNGLISSLPNYATEVLGLDKSSFTIPQLLCIVAACLMALPISKLQFKIKRKNMLIIGFVVMLTAFVTVYFQQELNTIMIIAFILAGAGYSTAIVNLYPYILELSNPDTIGKNTGVFNTVTTVAMVLTPIFSGLLSDRFSLKAALFPYCMAALIVSIIFLLFIKDKKKVRIKDIVLDG